MTMDQCARSFWAYGFVDKISEVFDVELKTSPARAPCENPDGAQQMCAWYGRDDQQGFFEDERTKRGYKGWVHHVLSWVISVTGVRYKDDATIFAWELMNELNIRPPQLFYIFYKWIEEMTAYVKSIDSNHLESSSHANVASRLFDLEIPTVDFGTLAWLPTLLQPYTSTVLYLHQRVLQNWNKAKRTRSSGGICPRSAKLRSSFSLPDVA